MSDVRIRITRSVDPAALADLVEPGMQNLGNVMARRMQRLVPKRTYALHDTIDATVERRRGTVTTIVGFGNASGVPRVDYGMNVERGTSKMRAQPFARPAFAQTTGADLLYNGPGPTRHGVASFSTRRSRARRRAGGA